MSGLLSCNYHLRVIQFREICEDQAQRQERNESTEDHTEQVHRPSPLASYPPIPRDGRFNRSPLGKGGNASALRGSKHRRQSRGVESMATADLGEAAGVHVVTPGSDLLDENFPRPFFVTQRTGSFMLPRA
jgi:hypothetical protein